VWQRAFDLELLACFDVLLAGEIAADQFNAIIGQMGEIGDGFFFDFAVFAIRVHEQMGGVPPMPSLASSRHYKCRSAWKRSYRHGWQYSRYMSHLASIFTHCV
jgi:hypothetical protein